MKVIVDNKIPYIQGIIEQLADEVIYLPGKAFTPEIVKDADALLTRTRTQCNRQLLEGSRVKFIGTATIGFDHIDTEYCKEAGITWSNCPGCNAGAVEQYIHAVLQLLQREKGIDLQHSCLGIVGVGHVGSRIDRLAKHLNMRVIAEECDIISFHTPLIKEGIYKTFHLADNDFFRQLKKRPYIINTSRGEVIDTQAILTALNERTISGAVIDVWENEPDINRELLDKVFIGTPHIAGYSADGKANATRMVLEAYCRFFGKEMNFKIAPTETPHVAYDSNEEIRILQQYNPHRDCEALRAHPERFEQLRGDYPLRRE